jgi:stalled ribosome rescue protein Dom34
MDNVTTHYHVIVWIDHSEARVFGIGREEADREVIRTHTHQRHLHHKANSRGSGHAPIDTEFFERTAQSVLEAGALLIVGPANARTEFATYLESRHPQLAKHISAIERLDHPADAALIALARKFFKADDRLR